MIRKLTEAECRYAIEHGDFEPSVRGGASAAALVLTQSWCPQWRFLQGYLEGIHRDLNAEDGTTADILYLEYDRETFFHEFMHFKEGTFGNREVPYVRYYRDGELVSESNFVSAQGFAARMKKGN